MSCWKGMDTEVNLPALLVISTTLPWQHGSVDKNKRDDFGFRYDRPFPLLKERRCKVRLDLCAIE
jgi:hypothetical protein